MKESNNHTEEPLVAVDRLSSFSDKVLIIILSSLSLDSTVASSVLSTRWRTLWTQLPYINIIPRLFKHGFRDWSTDFVDELIPKFTSPIIRRLIVDFSDRSHSLSRMPLRDSLFRQISERQVQEVHVAAANWAHECILVPLNSIIFQVRPLVSLTLERDRSGFAWSLPDHDYAFNLPVLKKLRLWVICSQCHLLETLVRACPSLEDLSVRITKPPYRCVPDRYPESGLLLSHPKLKRITARFDLHWNIDIDSPDLEYLCLSLYYPNTTTLRFVNRPKYLSNIRTLVVHQDISRDRYWLMILLEKCPLLEVLILHIDGFKRLEKCWISLACTLDHLKRIEMKVWGLCYRYHILKLARRLLSRAVILQRLVVSDEKWRKHKHCNEKVEQLFCRRLYDCPAVSDQCEIEFSGGLINSVRKAQVMPLDGCIGS